MKKNSTVKAVIALLLISVMLLGLCSCKLKKEDGTDSGTNAAPVNTDAGTTADSETVAPEETTQQPTQTAPATTQPVPTTAAPTSQPTTQREETTRPVEVTGTETVKESGKTVVYPKQLKSSQKRYPVISWANGTGCQTQLYISLLEALANGGYIVIADDSVMSGDGKAQIDSINYILNKNSDSSSIFYNKVDTSAIGVCGQSQGGRSCINAAQKDSRIRCAVSIAGASSADEARGLAIPCLFLTGTNDFIVVSSQWCLPSYEAVAGRAAYASLIGGDHLSFMNNTKKIATYTLYWFDAYLKNDANARAVFTDGGKLANDSAWQDFRNKN